MARMAILVPSEDLRGPAEKLVTQYENIDCGTIENVRTEHVAERAKELEAQGYDIILARGLQAEIVKHTVKLPIIEICVTTQELGCVILDIKSRLTTEFPRIGLIGHENTFGDISQFDRLFGVELKCYPAGSGVDSENSLRDAVEFAARDGCVALIGGNVVCKSAEQMGITSSFLKSGVESLKAALDIAEKVCYAIDIEKANNAQISTMLEFSSNGIIQMDSDCIILRSNMIAFDLLNCTSDAVIGKNLLSVFPSLSKDVVNRVLLDGEEVYAILLPLNRKETVVSMVPIRIDGRITGAILTLQEGKRIQGMNSELLHEIYRHGYVAQYSFDSIPCAENGNNELISIAKRVAKYDAPVLLRGEAGCGKQIMAQCIHNEGFTRGNAFISLDCCAYQSDTLDMMLFGNFSTKREGADCMVDVAQNGTIYLSHVESLSDELQYKVMKLINGRFQRNGLNLLEEAKIRIIASTEENIVELVKEGKFRSDLFYSLNALCLKIEPLRKRRDEINGWIELYLNQWKKRYDRYVVLTHGARDYLRKYDWPGNLNEVNCVCEQIVLLAERRSIDEVFLKRHIDRIRPSMRQADAGSPVQADEKALRILEVLQQYGGNRQKAADELGISKTTLWRYMKKYGIGKELEYSGSA